MNRRDVLAVGAGGLGLSTDATTMAADPAYPEPSLVFAFQANILLGQIQELGMVDGIRRRIVPIVGGTIEGPSLTGTVLPGGADWQGIRADDGLTRVSARYWAKAADGTAIGIDNAGIRRASPAVMRRLMAGESVSPTAYYFRTAPRFEVGKGKHEWLNESLFIGVGVRYPDRVIIRVYSVS